MSFLMFIFSFLLARETLACSLNQPLDIQGLNFNPPYEDFSLVKTTPELCSFMAETEQASTDCSRVQLRLLYTSNDVYVYSNVVTARVELLDTYISFGLPDVYRGNFSLATEAIRRGDSTSQIFSVVAPLPGSSSKTYNREQTILIQKRAQITSIQFKRSTPKVVSPSKTILETTTICVNEVAR